jgi:putative hydrolase of the HAD superfamily
MSTERNDSPNIKAVIFDYGLVLVRSPTAEEFGRMARMFSVSFELFYQLWESSRDLYDRGDISAEEYWLKLAAKTKTSIDSGQIEFLRKVEVEIWSHPNPEMLDWVRQLRTSGIKPGVLSNMPLDLAAHVRTNGHWMETFDFKTLSAEVRMIKPDPAIYEHTLHGLGVSATETLFIDDREPNIRAARMLGIHAIQFTSIGRLRNDLEVLGFPLLPAVGQSSSPVAKTASSDDSRERPGQEVKFQL